MSLVATKPTPRTRAAIGALTGARWFVASIAGLLATSIAAAGSWIPSLWGDEAASVMSAERSLPSLAGMLGHVDAVHGTYYLGLHWWIRVFGTSPFALRFPSAVAVGLATAAVVVVAWRLEGRRMAIIAGAVCVILPRVTYMGEEARSYAFSAAAAAWLTALLIEILHRREVRMRWWVAYGAVLAVGTYFFLYVALFAAVHAVILASVRARRSTLIGWGAAVAGAALASVPLGLVGLIERNQISYLAMSEQVTLPTLFDALWFGTWWVAAGAWALIVVAVVVAWRRRRGEIRATADPAPWIAKRGLPTLEGVAIAWLVVPTGILITAHAVIPDFTARYVSFCAPAAAILIACGIRALADRRRWAGIAAGSLIVALIVPVYIGQRTPYAKNDSDWAQVSAEIGANAHPGDGVIFDESVRPSWRPRLALHTYPAGFAGLTDVTLDVPFTQNDTWHDRAYSVAQADERNRLVGIERVWLVEFAATPSTPDSWGLDTLEREGFVQTGTRIATHRELIIELER
ncbi:glycosyltransferase family 39 protein [Leifsonia poae]|uniref:Membrane protein n=1 Tax=Leifsonia poae TaxID=110933 RepID=A0A9W6M0M7_9MICO|nr:glycosyltransferase family 39 protein [Leifsonia poae]GLJ76892.1 membrane protein [Leifsonia poae]